MGGLEIGLLLVGVLCFVVSFFLSEKLSSSDINEFEKMSKHDINVIVERQLRDADESIRRMIDEGMEDAMHDFNSKGDSILNRKIMDISDYSDGVIQTIEKSHQEIVFMYNMLLDKQESLTKLTADIQNLESHLLQMRANVMEAEEISVPDIDRYIESAQDISRAVYESGIEEDPEVDGALEEALIKEVSQTQEQGVAANSNDLILQMYNEGFSMVDIAKRLGRGLGEIKVVLGLFNRE